MRTGKLRLMMRAANFSLSIHLMEDINFSATFGIHSASEICQEQISQVNEGIENAANLQDDIIVWGSSREELHQSLKEVLIEFLQV